MDGHVQEALRDSGRAMVGALVLGMPFLYTMETWWLGWTMPTWQILAFALGGLLVILVVLRWAGFKEKEKDRLPGPLALATDVAELFLEVFVAAILVLWMFGVVQWGDGLHTTIRVALLQVVPLGLGAAIANDLLRSGEGGEGAEQPFPKDLALFAGGAIFFVLPIAPTEEMELMAARAGWERLALVVVASLLLAYLALYVLEFRGHAGRTEGTATWMRVGDTFAVYTIAFVVSYALLAGLGHFGGTPFEAQVQMTVTLAFAATLGGSAARVVL